MNACLYLQQTGVPELDRVQRCYRTTHLVREALADPILREYCSRFILGRTSIFRVLVIALHQKRFWQCGLFSRRAI